MRPRPAVLLAALLALPASALAQAPSAPAAPSGPAQHEQLTALLARSDADYARRDEPGALDRVKATLDEAERLAPQDGQVLWRLSRYYFWLADDPNVPDAEKSRLGKLSWEYGDKAIAVAPDRVEAWHYSAAGMGNYGLGIGVFKALRMGLEGKLKERFRRAEKLDPAFEHGAIQTAWGRFWFKLPWPKYNAEESEKALLAALEQNGDNVRARVYLADLYDKEDRGREAKEQLQLALASPPGRYDAPEERRWQAVAREMLNKKR